MGATVVAIAAVLAAGCSSSGGGGGAGKASSSKPAVTVGLIVDETGLAASSFGPGVVKGAMARIDLQNAGGGVDGRKIKLLVKDDESTFLGFQTAAQALVGTDNVFGLIADSAFVIGGYRNLHQQGIPVVGSGVDGPEWGQKQYTNMFSVIGVDPHYPQYTGSGDALKQLGATNVAVFGYGVSPSSEAAARGTAVGLRASGLKVGLLDTSIPFGSVNATPIALQMKQARVDSAILEMVNSTNFAIITAARQAGVHLKFAISATGYGQSLLDDPSAVAGVQGTYFTSICVPSEVHTKATTSMLAALAKYASFHGVPGFDYCEGYTTADLMIRGLEAAGPNPTRQSFISGLRKVTNYDAGGLLPNPVNFTPAAIGQPTPTSCAYTVQLKGKMFVPVPANGKPVCGKLIPNSNTQ
ncbi:MAG: ABC transporter substrate-binding protein [Acidimicrobiaceae bacterium]|nr:ABC transporter substrate-binding protein [Acidimicrobiaceae bacterium]